MGFIAEVLWQIKLGDYKSAANLLETHLGDTNLKTSSKVGLMEWMADCYSKCEETEVAAKWFEMAGQAAIDCRGFSEAEKRRKAAEYFERALECHKVCNNIQGIKRMAALKYSITAKS